jgi:ubiquinone/menaquinone biosynthesis C-methylase UbiE
LNHFASAATAARYARGRPDVHRGIVRRIGRGLRLSQQMDRALDVGCGTGLSSRALREMARVVVGVDLSEAMLSHAARAGGPFYAVSEAEALPFGAGQFDLITCGLAFHWFERGKFFPEAHRVLREGGSLVIYDHFFSGRMREGSAFDAWHRSEYLRRYPAPPRKGRVDLEELDPSLGFRLAGRDDATEEVAFSARQLADYLLTQSNISVAVEDRREPLEDVAVWLEEQAAALTPDPVGHFEFQSSIWFLARV